MDINPVTHNPAVIKKKAMIKTRPERVELLREDNLPHLWQIIRNLYLRHLKINFQSSIRLILLE